MKRTKQFDTEVNQVIKLIHGLISPNNSTRTQAERSIQQFELTDRNFLFKYFQAYSVANHNECTYLGLLLKNKFLANYNFMFGKEQEEIFVNSLLEDIKNEAKSKLSLNLLAIYMSKNNHLLLFLQQRCEKILLEKDELSPIFQILNFYFELNTGFPDKNVRQFFFKLLLENLKSSELDRSVALCFSTLIPVYTDEFKDELEVFLFNDSNLNEKETLDLLLVFKEYNPVSKEQFGKIFEKLVKNHEESEEEEVKMGVLEFFLAIQESSGISEIQIFDEKMLERLIPILFENVILLDYDESDEQDWNIRRQSCLLLDEFALIFENQINKSLIPLIEEGLKSKDYLDVERSILLAGILFKKQKRFHPELFSNIFEFINSKEDKILRILCWSFSTSIKHLIAQNMHQKMKVILDFYFECMKSSDFKLFKSGNSAICEFCDDLSSVPVFTKFDMTSIFNFLVQKYQQEYYYNEEIQLHLMDTVDCICEYGEFEQNSESVHSLAKELLESVKEQPIETNINAFASMLSLPDFFYYPYLKQIFDTTYNIITDQISIGNLVNVPYILGIHLNMFIKYERLVENLITPNYLEIIYSFHSRSNTRETRLISNALLCEIFSYKSLSSKNFVDKLILSFSDKFIEDQYEIFLYLNVAYLFNLSFLKNSYSKIYDYLPFLVKLDFENMDKKYHEYAQYWYNFIVDKKNHKQYTNDEIEFLINTFSEIVVTNVSYSNENIFKMNIVGVKDALEVRLVLDGKYFRLSPNNQFLQDLNFKFK
eukprot:gene4684-8256_t